ncbi:hypothetical protein N0V91_011370, partial [Didymella pomorum]
LVAFTPFDNALNREFGKTLANLDVSKEEFDHLRHEKVHRIEQLGCGDVAEREILLDVSDHSSFKSKYFEVLDRLTGQEVETQRLRKEASLQGWDMPAIPRRHSAPYAGEEEVVISHKATPTAHSDSATRALAEDDSTNQRIRDWLFTHLTENVVERALYRSIASTFGIKWTRDEELKRDATRHWNSDSQSNMASKALAYTGLTESGFKTTLYQDPQVNFDSQSGLWLEALDPAMPDTGQSVQSVPRTKNSDASTVVRHQASFETFMTDDSQEHSEEDFSRPGAPMIVFRPASPPARMDSPHSAAVDTPCSVDDPSPAASRSIDTSPQSTQRVRSNTWVCIHQPVTDVSVDNEVPAEYLTDGVVPSDQSITPAESGIVAGESNASRSQTSFFDYVTIRPRSVSLGEGADRTGIRNSLLRKQKRTLSASANFPAKTDE